jgi:hypothetical protein
MPFLSLSTPPSTTRQRRHRRTDSTRSCRRPSSRRMDRLASHRAQAEDRCGKCARRFREHRRGPYRSTMALPFSSMHLPALHLADANLGPHRSAKIVIGRPTCLAAARTSLIHGAMGLRSSPCEKLSRATSMPAFDELDQTRYMPDVAGPRVQTIFTLRIALPAFIIATEHGRRSWGCAQATATAVRRLSRLSISLMFSTDSPRRFQKDRFGKLYYADSQGVEILRCRSV